MKAFEIGETIKVNTRDGVINCKVTGRNWAFENLLSYIVDFNGLSMPVDAETFKPQLKY